MVSEFLLLALGLILLIGGAEFLVRGSADIARSFGISPLIIGLTIVAFGTSAPELFVSLDAALSGTADVAVGNVVGSNIFNILMIIGLSALIKPVEISRAVLTREMPLMLAVLGVMVYCAYNGIISRLEGVILFMGIIAYLIMNYVLVKRRRVAALMKKELGEGGEDEQAEDGLVKNLFFVVGGLVALVAGAHWIVDSALIIARHFAISEFVIGISLVAIGTSLPEVATTISAARRKQGDLAVGNAIGSNIFNVLCVVGATATVTPLPVNQSAIDFDMWFMFFACLVVWPFMKTGNKVSRLEGSVMIAAYVWYICYLFSVPGSG